MSVLNFVSGIFHPLMQGLDELTTSDEERMALQNQLTSLQSAVTTRLLDHEAKIIEAQSALIAAEANGQSWLQRNWRPLTMLVFVGLIVARWLGFTAPGMSETEYLSVYGLMKLGLGGYVVGRSAEKLAPQIAQAWADRKGTQGGHAA